MDFYSLWFTSLRKDDRTRTWPLVQTIISKGEGDFARAHNGGVGTRQAAATHGLKVQYARTDIRKYRIHIFICSESGRVWNSEGTLSLFSTFVYRGSSYRQKCAGCPTFDMVWLYRSHIPLGRRGVISSFIIFLPGFAKRRGRRGGGVGTLWCGTIYQIN